MPYKENNELKDNESICVDCGSKTNDDKKETFFDRYADPHCKDCYNKLLKEGKTR